MTCEDLKKAALVAQTLYYSEKQLRFQGGYITGLQLLDQDEREVHFFDPTEEDGVSQMIQTGIQPEFYQFQVNTVSCINEWYLFQDGKMSGETSLSPITLKQLHELWANCL